MIRIQFKPAELSAEEAVKQTAATRQMQELLAELKNGRKYSTLTVSDRQSLLQKGYAKDLVDNLVFLTERVNLEQAQPDADRLVVGYTHAAFDPSIYACDSIIHALRDSHAGRCAYCESKIDHIGANCVSHYRPAWGAIDSNHLEREPYYPLAYDQSNLLLSCHECHEQHKGSLFPVNGTRYPANQIESEEPLLVNPYLEDPRQSIRFNPIDGEAYAYDIYHRFLQQNLGLSASDADDYIWQHPENIPSSTNIENKDNTHIADYLKWRSQHQKATLKGASTIKTLGLNRPALVQTRISHLHNLRTWLLSKNPGGDSVEKTASKLVNELTDTRSIYCNQLPYQSLSIDALNTWATAANQAQNWLNNYQHFMTRPVSDNDHSSDHSVAPWMSSSLAYMVMETELDLSGKRRIVSLHGSDYLYGSDRKVKTVFLPIDWQQDFDNVVKVAEANLVWEASFSELSKTHPIALQNLFANNEVWAQGDYAALS